MLAGMLVSGVSDEFTWCCLQVLSGMCVSLPDTLPLRSTPTLQALTATLHCNATNEDVLAAALWGIAHLVEHAEFSADLRYPRRLVYRTGCFLCTFVLRAPMD